MGRLSLKFIPVLAAAGLLVGCAEGPVEYNSDYPGPVLHYISTDPSEIFRNKVNHEADLEARGVEPPVGNASWHEFWIKMIAYWSANDAGIGSHREIAGYIVQQRRARGLAPL